MPAKSARCMKGREKMANILSFVILSERSEAKDLTKLIN
jgi:hypothetical protein